MLRYSEFCLVPGTWLAGYRVLLLLFQVKSIATETKTNDAVNLPKCMSYNHICARVPSKVKLVIWRTLLLFHCKYLRRTLLYLGVYFCLAFG